MTFQDLPTGAKFKILQSGLNWRDEILVATWTKIQEIRSLAGRYNCTSDSDIFPDTWIGPGEEVTLV